VSIAAMSEREGRPFMSADEYGRTLGGMTLNLIVRDVAKSVPFYTGVLGFRALHQTADYVALEREGATIQLHGDRTYMRQPWGPHLADAKKRGFGVEIRILGIDPDEAERRARADGHAVLAPAKDWPPHGWRDCLIEDPDGYTFSVGVPLLRDLHP
jgi:catechol 2,3-dioxygenase-like lactoylglutathione lyase family enzyme